VERLPREGQLYRLQARELQQLTDQVIHPLRLLVDDARGVGVRVGRAGAVDQRAGEALDRGERRLQVVRDVGQEVALAAAGALDLARHRVEARRQLADLVPPLHRDTPGVVAARQRARGGGEGEEGPGDR